MNDEKLATTNTLEASPTSDDPPAAQVAEGESEGGTETESSIGESPAKNKTAGATEESAQTDADVGPAVSDADPAIPDDPGTDPDPLLPEDPESDPTESVERLRHELQQLREEIRDREEFYGRVGRDYEEFRTLYPNVNVSDLPDSVWKDVRCGIPIAAAYALAEQRRRRIEEQARAANLANAERSSGPMLSGEPEFFSPADVRAMTRDEVRHNYQKIIQSMKKWN